MKLSLAIFRIDVGTQTNLQNAEFLFRPDAAD
jgi:hypothetical protein